ncbi:MAG TPA: chloride channel protein [Rhodocyclaceae bacterium]|nr:chloride channel protein [Rhodocyclaceae bacterium]
MTIPSFLSRIKHHRLDDITAWRDRLLMWGAAGVAGLCIVGFTLLTDKANDIFQSVRGARSWAPFLITPLGGMLVVWLTRRFAPASAGSGIPQVMAALNAQSATRQFVSTRLSVAKAAFGSLALLAGFSAGREGPAVQIAAGVMHGFRNGFSAQSKISPQDLMLVGGAAGIAAAFNAPLAGVIFAIEELSRRFEQRSSGLIVTAIVLAGVVSISMLGNFTYFGRIDVKSVSIDLLLPGTLCAIFAGGLGGFFSRLLIISSIGTADRFSHFRARRPILFAGFCGLCIAALGFVSNGAAHGSGFKYTHGVLAGEQTLPFLFSGVKFLATWLTYWSGVPGGVFAPALAVGAGLGNDVAIITHTAFATPLIVIGMAGFLAAATQAPITSFIIVMEMIDGHTMVLSLMATALAASLISKLISPPLYHTLSELQLANAIKPPALSSSVTDA